MEGRKRLVVLDTHAILHRAYHALPDFSSSRGEPTGALYGLVSMLVKLISDLKPDYLVAAVDLPGKTLRHEVFGAYKATRPEAAEDLVAQIKRSRDVLAAFGIPIYAAEGYEADDVIGTIVEKLKKKKDIDIVIASGDMDTLQLVQDKRIQVFTFKKGLSETTLYDEEKVRARFGFGPEHLPDYKGLRGDPSDNIPGVHGVGEKTAAQLIAAFGTIEKLYAALKKNPKNVIATGARQSTVEKLKSQEKEAKVSKALCEIKKDAPISFALPERAWREGVDAEKLLSMLAELEFRSLIPRVRELLVATAKLTDSGYADFSAEKSAKVGSSSLAKPSPSAVSPLPEEFRNIALAVWVLDSSITEPTVEDILRVGRAKDFETAARNILREIKERGLSFVYEKIELPLASILRRMEARGVLIDVVFLKKLSAQYHEDLEEIARRIYVAAGAEFNLNSPRQLGEVLFDKLGLSIKNQKKTPGGARSTRESELQKLRPLHPIIDDILAYRELQKLLSTYIDIIPELLDDKNRLHTTFVQTGTSTGRLASKDPNLQNIPIKSELGRAIRRAFVADEAFQLISFDYSQIELRIAAILSGDEELVDIFRRGRDVHAEVAARMFGTAPGGGVSYEHRRAAKVINFGILYGMGITALQQALGTNRAEAQEFYNRYFATFPRLKQFVDEVKADAHRKGYTETLFGRRRYVEGIRSPIPYVRAAAERMAVNAPMQGTQADVIKLAMIKINDLFEKEGLHDRAFLLLQVHDELLFEIVEEEAPRLAPKIKEIMENIIPRKERKGVPLVAEGKIGKNWEQMQPI